MPARLLACCAGQLEKPRCCKGGQEREDQRKPQVPGTTAQDRGILRLLFGSFLCLFGLDLSLDLTQMGFLAFALCVHLSLAGIQKLLHEGMGRLTGRCESGLSSCVLLYSNVGSRLWSDHNWACWSSGLWRRNHSRLLSKIGVMKRSWISSTQRLPACGSLRSRNCCTSESMAPFG